MHPLFDETYSTRLVHHRMIYANGDAAVSGRPLEGFSTFATERPTRNCLNLSCFILYIFILALFAVRRRRKRIQLIRLLSQYFLLWIALFLQPNRSISRRIFSFFFLDSLFLVITQCSHALSHSRPTTKMTKRSNST